MAYKKQSRIPGGFIPLPNKMLSSESWKALSHTAKLMYINLLSQAVNGTDRVICPHNAALPCPMHTNTMTKAIRELEHSEWIVIVHQGRFGRDPSVYRLTECWKRAF